MILRKHGYVLDVDLKETRRYSREHGLCCCEEDKNLYVQIRDKFPKLAAFLAELGLLIERPDETAPCDDDADNIDYHFVSYTVIGDILEADKYELELLDGDTPLRIVIDHQYVPNEQKTDRYFTVTVYNISLPWVMDEPLQEEDVQPLTLWQKIQRLFRKP